MINRFIKYKKYKEYVANAFECKFAAFVTLVCVVLLCYFRYYENFSQYYEITNTILVTILAGFLGGLALIFSGISFWGSIFDEKFIAKLIKYSKDNDVVDKLFTSYLFLAFNIICHIVCTLGFLIAVNSVHEILRKLPFLICIIFYLYWTFFILGYIVAIMRNCVDLVLIQNKPVDTSSNNKTMYETANELRVDLLFEVLYRNASSQEMHDDLLGLINRRINMMDNSQEEKDALIKYMEQYYQLPKK